MGYKHFMLALFMVAFTFTACSDDDNKITEEEENKDEFVFVGISPMRTITNEDKIPFSWDSFGWKYENGKLVSYSPKFAANIKTANVVEHTANKIVSQGKYAGTGGYTEIFTSEVVLENGLVKKHNLSSTSIQSHLYSLDYNYNYNADGYLESVTGITKNGLRTENTEILLTWKNGNLIKVTKTIGMEVETYTYTYDDKAYEPMSDFSVYTPLDIYAPYPLIEFYAKLGKQSKNNIAEVNIEYNLSSYKITKLTYQVELNEIGTIKQINHTGIYTPHFSAEDQNPISFKGIRTLFDYEKVKKN